MLKNTLRWACRRGMLELDLLLLPFLEKEFDHLTPQEQELFSTLLKEDDQNIYQWILKSTTCPFPLFRPMLNKIYYYATNDHVH